MVLGVWFNGMGWRAIYGYMKLSRQRHTIATAAPWMSACVTYLNPPIPHYAETKDLKATSEGIKGCPVWAKGFGIAAVERRRGGWEDGDNNGGLLEPLVAVGLLLLLLVCCRHFFCCRYPFTTGPTSSVLEALAQLTPHRSPPPRLIALAVPLPLYKQFEVVKMKLSLDLLGMKLFEEG